jgi:hypothetical protein
VEVFVAVGPVAQKLAENVWPAIRLREFPPHQEFLWSAVLESRQEHLVWNYRWPDFPSIPQTVGPISITLGDGVLIRKTPTASGKVNPLLETQFQ